MTTAEWKTSARLLAEENILKFWLERMTDQRNGGFYGRIDGSDRLYEKADKGAVLNARILWSFASAYRVLGKEAYKEAAVRAKDYFVSHFIDPVNGGVYWSVDYLGNPKETKKQTYAIGFAVYGMSELYRATGDKEALEVAKRLFEDIEKHAFDEAHPGYIEAMTCDWMPVSDMRLSDKDENAAKTMNTHLHVLEPYTNLFRVWKDERLEQRLRMLIRIFTDRLLNKQTRHLDLFFTNDWKGRRNLESYGHDIEAAWLLTEALEVLGDEQLSAETMPIVRQIALASEEGLCPDGSMIHEMNVSTGETDMARHWWVQCECVIGELNHYQHFGDEIARQRAVACYRYILDRLVDSEHGEWHWSIMPDGTVNREDDKAGPWKCPYHNTRMCLEIIERDF
ncbi:MAG: AGE family epimerase/isomerase [Prevotella sp.]|nr:AGE family epimerase/isomerase [Prevotella sp.]